MALDRVPAVEHDLEAAEVGVSSLAMFLLGVVVVVLSVAIFGGRALDEYSEQYSLFSRANDDRDPDAQATYLEQAAQSARRQLLTGMLAIGAMSAIFAGTAGPAAGLAAFLVGALIVGVSVWMRWSATAGRQR
jgi:hypothetical protein